MAMKKINSLERDNATIQSMRNKIIDLQARSMRNNLLFFNIPEHEKENTTESIHDLLEQKIEIETHVSMSSLTDLIELAVREKTTKNRNRSW
jgi:hypothetical protein